MICVLYSVPFVGGTVGDGGVTHQSVVSSVMTAGRLGDMKLSVTNFLSFRSNPNIPLIIINIKKGK